LNLEQAIAAVRAAGYRVSKPRPKRQSVKGPTCVVQFADGTITRMTTHCPNGKLDFGRGERLAIAAYESRARQWPTGTNAITPPIASLHFERDGQVLETSKGV
jgi:hypothetical protein